MSTWTKGTKHSASWSKPAKHSATWAKTNHSLGLNSFLLLESGFYLLLEDGFKLILEQSNPAGPTWSKQVKS